MITLGQASGTRTGLGRRNQQSPPTVRISKYWTRYLQRENYSPTQKEIEDYCRTQGIQWRTIRGKVLRMVREWGQVVRGEERALRKQKVKQKARKRERKGKVRPPPIPVGGKGMGERPPLALRARKEAELGIVAVSDVVGVVRNPHWVDDEFRPKRRVVNKRLRKVWRWISGQSPDRKDYHSNTMVLARVDERYYVVEGLRRMIALKQLRPEAEVRVQVLDYREEYWMSQEKKKKREEMRTMGTVGLSKPSPIMRMRKTR